MSAHTPGPWFPSQYLDNDEWGVLSQDNVIVVGLSSRITKADARLIAAAPRMYDFIQRIAGYTDIPWTAEQARDILRDVEDQ